MSSSSSSPPPMLRRLYQGGSVVLTWLQLLFAVVAVAVLVTVAVPQVRGLAKAQPVAQPATMEDVDWHAPESGQYCLACHRQVGMAAGGIEVERGHSQNVALDAHQQQAVAELGTIAGPDDTLTCMSCHELGRQTDTPYMLAETLDNSQLCQHCHPGHYARGTPHDLQLSAPQETNRLGQTPAESGPCGVCHLAHQHAREIVRSPRDPEGYCVTCHSEYEVAARHTRSAIEHPESRCRECHDPHDMTHGAFLSEEIGTLCLRCHEDYGGGLADGTHPLGPMDLDVPAELLAAGAHMMDDPHVLTCVVCHDTHEAEHRALLHVTPDENHLCLACHEDKLLENAGASILPKHGQQPVLDESQRAVVARWGNPVGPKGELLCISCHDPHGAEPNTKLLTFRPKYNETCSACHPEHEGVAGSPHDLRIEHPDLENDVGLTASTAGVCSPCHMAHHFPRERTPTKADPGGQCITCHQEGQCAAAKLTGGVDHPGTTCIDCHNPHERRYGAFLAAPPAELCVRCHEDAAHLIGGPHDLRETPAAWPAKAVATGDPCLSCHVPHGGERADLFRFRVPTGHGNHDGVCMACHEDASWNVESPVAAVHPRKIAPEHVKVDLSLVPTDVHGDKRMGCRTCHDPHGGATPVHLARAERDEPTEELCLSCHTEKRLMRYTGHSAEALHKAGHTTDSCKPCHAMHAQREGSWGELLSPRFLLAVCNVSPEEAASCVPCLACHRADGSAPERTFTHHPEVLIMNVFHPDDPGYMPLFGPDGHLHPQGQITCRTCHISHGRTDLLRKVAESEDLSPEQQEALKAQVRSFAHENICTACHGPQARTLFLYFHEPQHRPRPTQVGPRGRSPQ